MRTTLCLSFAVLACSSAPAPERSAHADASERDGGAPEANDGGGAAEAPAAGPPADDVGDDALASMQQRYGCTREGPAIPGSHGVACALLGRFAHGRAPTFAAGALPGVALSPAPDGPDVARPALLAVRGEADALEVAWGIASPSDPRSATELAAMAADILEGRAPSLALAPWPGLAWTRVRPTHGASLALATEPRILARAEGDATIVLVLDGDAPLVALHRTGAGSR